MLKHIGNLTYCHFETDGRNSNEELIKLFTFNGNFFTKNIIDENKQTVVSLTMRKSFPQKTCSRTELLNQGANAS